LAHPQVLRAFVERLREGEDVRGIEADDAGAEDFGVFRSGGRGEANERARRGRRKEGFIAHYWRGKRGGCRVWMWRLVARFLSGMNRMSISYS